MTKKLLSGDEAIARGAWEAGCLVAAAYPGTPSTEILEAMATYKEVDSRWTSNEKVALEVASGASIGGVRSLAAMKHVGVNVAADPLLTMSYIGAKGGLVVVSADDPGCHSSQNEQDNRHYAVLAKMPMLEPADSQECLDFTREAFALSERFDRPILLRLTTRTCHSKGLTVVGERPAEPPIYPYERNVQKNCMLPAFARTRHAILEDILKEMAAYGNDCPFNRVEWASDRKIGVITSGVSYLHARETFGDSVSYLKLGLTYPLPQKLMADFAKEVDEIYVIEEGDPYLETALKAMGFSCVGKDKVPILGELNAGILRQIFRPDSVCPTLPTSNLEAPPRPPVLCAGCPHRGIMHILGRKKKEIVTCGDIGCYTLGLQPPLDATDTTICMGGGFSAPIGLSVALKAAGDKRKAFGLLGDSTFFHSGLTGLVDAIHSQADVCLCILDNDITAMTGHQENPGTVKDLCGRPAPALNLEKVVLGLGLPQDRLIVVDPLDKDAVTAAIDKAIATTGPMVIITKRPCVLIKELRGTFKSKCSVDSEKCKKCKQCLKVACPAISFQNNASYIDPEACLGCDYCRQVCKFEAISIKEVTP